MYYVLYRVLLAFKNKAAFAVSFVTDCSLGTKFPTTKNACDTAIITSTSPSHGTKSPFRMAPAP